MRAVLLSLVLLAACGGADRHAAEAYASAMTPVLAKNAALGSEFEDVASRVKQGQLDGPAVGERFSTVIVPLAQEIANRAAAIDPEGEALDAAHATLVTAWSERAAAYQDIAAAWGRGDGAVLAGSRARISQVRNEELTWQDAVNAYTRPLGVAIDLYPAPGG